MNPMMPAKRTPLAFRTVAKGMLPIDPINLAAATKGASKLFSSTIQKLSPEVFEAISARKMDCQKGRGTSTATNPATVRPIRI